MSTAESVGDRAAKQVGSADAQRNEADDDDGSDVSTPQYPHSARHSTRRVPVTVPLQYRTVPPQCPLQYPLKCPYSAPTVRRTIPHGTAQYQTVPDAVRRSVRYCAVRLGLVVLRVLRVLRRT